MSRTSVKTSDPGQNILDMWSCPKHPTVYQVHDKWFWAAENIKDVLVWTKGLKDLLDRTKYDQMSRTFSHGPSDSMDILNRTKQDQYQEHFGEDRLSPWTFWTGPNMNKYQGTFAVEQTPTWTFWTEPNMTEYPTTFGRDQLTPWTFWTGPHVLQGILKKWRKWDGTEVIKHEGRPRSSYVCTLYMEVSHALSWTILAAFCKMITLLQPV